MITDTEKQAIKEKMNGKWTALGAEIEAARECWAESSAALKKMGEHNDKVFEIMLDIAKDQKQLWGETIEAEEKTDE